MGEPTRIDFAVHRAKVQAHRVRRWVIDRRAPVEAVRPGRLLVDRPILAEDRSPLWNAGLHDAREWALELGKVENLRVAARSLDGLEFAAGQVFSFWAQVGAPLRLRGFVPGRELREGCVVPGVGGGLCLLSNALFAVARDAGMDIVERHAHSRRPPGSRAALGEDATVAWNYVDLRFVADHPWRLELGLDADHLRVRVRGERRRGRPGKRGLELVGERRGQWGGEAGPSCMSCDQPCHRAEPRPPIGGRGAGPSPTRRSWLVDGVWPEFADYLQAEGGAEDRLLAPLDGRRLRQPRYAWPSEAIGGQLQFPVRAALRSLRSRSLARQGAARQRALLEEDARLAAAMAARLEPKDTQLVVAQNLLPFLWRAGALGGRRVTVLMQRLPLLELQARLDEAKQANAQSPTLADFRADPRLVEDEARALDEAAAIVTPHAEIAACYASKAVRLPWSLPAAAAVRRRSRRADEPLRLWLPASTVGRKGCWELREALTTLEGGCQLWISGRELEGPAVWAGLEGLRIERGAPSLAEIDAVVLPAWIEHSPRALLRAAAAGVPVIASRACGLADLDAACVESIPTGCPASLHDALDRLRRSSQALDPAAAE